MRIRKVTAGLFNFIEPMECLEVSKLPEGPEWSYEVKLDGFRAQVLHDNGRLRLLSRNGLDLSARVPGMVRELEDVVPPGCVLDGELTALDPNGRPSFELLQNARSNDAPIVFYGFDILRLAGKDLTQHQLGHRQRLLRDTIPETLCVQLSQSFDIPAAQMLALVEEHSLEGVVAKRLDSVYQPGQRTGAWRKLRVNLAQEFVIGGFTLGSNGFDAVVIGFYQGKALVYAGRVRNGFIPLTRRALFAKLKPYITNMCPFANLPEASAGRWGQGLDAKKMKECIWLTPKIVAQFSFLEWTSANHLRHVRYVGLREDKDARSVVKEAASEGGSDSD